MKNSRDWISNKFKTAQNENLDWRADFLNYCFSVVGGFFLFFFFLFPNMSGVCQSHSVI